MMTDREAIETQLWARNDAVRDGRCEDAMRPLASDIVAYDLQPPLEFHGDAARDVAGLQAWLATWNGPVSLSMPDPFVTISGDLAVVYGLSRMRGEKRDGERIDLWYRSTLALRQEAGEWRCFHEHHSVPMKMDGSGHAAVDLKPAHAPAA